MDKPTLCPHDFALPPANDAVGSWCPECLRAEILRLRRELLIARGHCPKCLGKDWQTVDCEVGSYQDCRKCGHGEITG